MPYSQMFNQYQDQSYYNQVRIQCGGMHGASPADPIVAASLE